MRNVYQIRPQKYEEAQKEIASRVLVSLLYLFINNNNEVFVY